VRVAWQPQLGSHLIFVRLSLSRVLKKQKTFEAVKVLAGGVKDAVKKGFEEKAEECGQITGEWMKNMIVEYHTKMETLIDFFKLTTLQDSFPPDHNQNDGASNENDDDDGIVFAEGEGEENVVNNQAIRHRLYAYEGRFWHVLKDFDFPLDVHLGTGWKIWVCGLPSNETVGVNDILVQAPVLPFRNLKPTMLPLDARKKVQLHWKPIFSLMESVPADLAILPVMDTDSISLSFSVGKQYLKARVSYVFESIGATPDRWGISTWSKKVARSSILKHGNVSDKANIPVATHHNQPRQQCNPCKRPLADLRRIRRWVEREPAATNDGDGDGPVRLLLAVNLTATDIARGEEIEREVSEEMAEELREHRRVTNAGRPDGHGGVIFVGPQFQN
jgi:hypothetical protein